MRSAQSTVLASSGRFGPGSCGFFGYTWEHSPERMTRDRISGPLIHRNIYTKCYEITRRAEASPFQMLPGIMNPGMRSDYPKIPGEVGSAISESGLAQDPETKTARCEYLPKGRDLMPAARIEGMIPDATGILSIITMVCAFMLSFANLQAGAVKAGITPWQVERVCVDALLIAGSLMFHHLMLPSLI